MIKGYEPNRTYLFNKDDIDFLKKFSVVLRNRPKQACT
jgi:hypothetical protein